MTTMELKNIRYSALASEETHCYEAKLYIDGKLVAVCRNDGHGGPDMQHPAGNHDRASMEAEIERAVDALGLKEAHANEMSEFMVKNGLENVDTTMDLGAMNVLEGWCSDRVTDHLIRKDMLRSMQSKVLIKKPNERGIFEVRFKGTRKIDERHVAAVRAKAEAGTIILNDMPEAEALALYRAEAA